MKRLLIFCILATLGVYVNAITCYVDDLPNPNKTADNCNYCGYYRNRNETSNPDTSIIIRACLDTPEFSTAIGNFSIVNECNLKKIDGNSYYWLYLCDYEKCNEECIETRTISTHTESKSETRTETRHFSSFHNEWNGKEKIGLPEMQPFY